LLLLSFALRVALQLLKALEFLFDHNRGHCDVMMANFMIETKRSTTASPPSPSSSSTSAPSSARDRGQQAFLSPARTNGLDLLSQPFLLHVIDTEQMAACSFFNRNQIAKDLWR
ncbi:unnamed protein product, partial [Amoebophrya sp. A120]